MTRPKLLKILVFTPFLRVWTVSEKEDSSETMVSAVIDLNSG